MQAASSASHCPFLRPWEGSIRRPWALWPALGVKVVFLPNSSWIIDRPHHLTGTVEIHSRPLVQMSKSNRNAQPYSLRSHLQPSLRGRAKSETNPWPQRAGSGARAGSRLPAPRNPAGARGVHPEQRGPRESAGRGAGVLFPRLARLPAPPRTPRPQPRAAHPGPARPAAVPQAGRRGRGQAWAWPAEAPEAGREPTARRPQSRSSSPPAGPAPGGAQPACRAAGPGWGRPGEARGADLGRRGGGRPRGPRRSPAAAATCSSRVAPASPPLRAARSLRSGPGRARPCVGPQRVRRPPPPAPIPPRPARRPPPSAAPPRHFLCAAIPQFRRRAGRRGHAGGDTQGGAWDPRRGHGAETGQGRAGRGTRGQRSGDARGDPVGGG